MKLLPKVIHSIGLIALLAVFSFAFASDARGMSVYRIAYDGQGQLSIAYDGSSVSAFNYDSSPFFPANQKENQSARTSGNFGHFAEFLAAEETAFSSTLNKVGTLDFSTPANGAVFYSGAGQGARAAAFAEQTAGMTIEMTSGGQQLMADPVFQSLSPGQQYQVWQAASTPFAQGASGGVNAFISGAGATGTFRTIEEPILTANPNVFNYTYYY